MCFLYALCFATSHSGTSWHADFHGLPPIPYLKVSRWFSWFYCILNPCHTRSLDLAPTQPLWHKCETIYERVLTKMFSRSENKCNVHFLEYLGTFNITLKSAYFRQVWKTDMEIDIYHQRGRTCNREQQVGKRIISASLKLVERRVIKVLQVCRAYGGPSGKVTATYH